MKDGRIRLYVFILSLVFSLGTFVLFLYAIAPYRPEAGLIKGITGNAAFYNINKKFDLLLYFFSLVLIPGATLLCYRLLSKALSPDGAERGGENDFHESSDIPASYHALMLFYGASIGYLFSLNSLLIIAISTVFLTINFFFASKSKDKIRAVNLSAVAFSPLTFFHLKAPFFVALNGRYSTVEELSKFTISIAAIALLFVILIGLRARKKSSYAIADALPAVATASFIYGFFFNPDINGDFDYYHEAEQALSASIVINSADIKDALPLFHGLIQDLGIGWCAFKLFGETLEGLRLLRMFLYPAGAVVFFMLAMLALRKVHLALAALLYAFFASWPLLEASGYNLTYTPFSPRFMASGLSLCLLIKFIEGRRYIFLAASSAAAFISLLWSMDVGALLLISTTLTLAALSIAEGRLHAIRRGPLPVFLGMQAAFFLFLYSINAGIIKDYIEIFRLQGGVQMLVSPFPYPGTKDPVLFSLGYLNPAALIFSATVLAVGLLAKKWDKRDYTFLALIIFSAIFFSRGVVLSNGAHLVFGSSYIPIVFVYAAEKLSHMSGRSSRFLPGASAAFIIFIALNVIIGSEFVAGYPQRKLVFERSSQELGTDKIGDISVGDAQAEGINAILEFFEGEGKGEEYIFDFSSNFGVTAWILNKTPIIGPPDMALFGTEAGQRYVIERLEEKRPKFIIYSSSDPYSKYLGINNFVRYPLVAAYIFKNYLPYAQVQNYRVMVGKEKAYEGSTGRYKGTLNARDLFERAELGYIPYIIAKDRAKAIEDKHLLIERAFTDSGAVEIGNIDIPSDKASVMLVEAECGEERMGKMRMGKIMWDSGGGYAEEQSASFHIKGGGKSHEYLINLSSLPSWHYAGSIKSLKVGLAKAGGTFRVRKVWIYE